MRCRGIGAAVVLALFAATWPVESRGAGPPQAVALARDGRALLPILTPAPLADRAGHAAAADELRSTLARVTGATFEVRAAAPGMSGIYLGRPVDFPWFGIADDLGPEGVLLRSGGEGVLVLGHPGHAVSSFLHHLGCRWFFPGDAWEVLPREPTLTVRLSRRESPAFPIQRRIWYGFGAYPKCRADKSAWDGRNRLGGSVRVAIGHTWHGLEQTPIWGHPAHLLRLHDGRVLCTYGYRREPFGVRACLSADGGRTWDIDNEIVLRADGTDRDLGYPSSVQFPGGDIFTAYYIHHSDPARYIGGTRWRV